MSDILSDIFKNVKSQQNPPWHCQRGVRSGFLLATVNGKARDLISGIQETLESHQTSAGDRVDSSIGS